MNVGIIGSGNIGSNLGYLLAQAGYSVMISSSHPEESLPLADELGQNARLATVKEATEFGQIIVLAIPFKYIPETAAQIGKLSDKIMIDAANPCPQRDRQMAETVLADPDTIASRLTAQ